MEPTQQPPPPPIGGASSQRTRTRLVAAVVTVFVAMGAASAVALIGARGDDPRPLDEAVPATADLALIVSLEPSAEQAMHLASLLSRFPTDRGLRDRLDQALDEALGEANLARDDLAWLGAEVGVFADLDLSSMGTGSGGFGHAAVVAASTDDGAASAALERARRTVGGSWRRTSREGVTIWVDPGDQAYAVTDGFVIAGNHPAVTAAVDTIAGGAPSLASVPRYVEAVAELPADRFVTGYMDAGRLFADLADALEEVEGAPTVEGFAPELDAYEGVAMSIRAEADGLAFDGVTRYDPARLPEAMRERLAASPTGSHPLLSSVPADAYGAFAQRDEVNLDDFGRQLGLMEPSSQEELERLGIVGEDGLLSFLAGDVAFEVGPGAPVAASLLLSTSDSAGFVAAVRTVIERVDPATAHSLTRSRHGGVAVWTVPIAGLEVAFAADGPVAVVASSPTRMAAILDTTAGAPSIVDGEAFARGTSRVPTEDTVGFVDVAAILAAVREALPPQQLETFDREVAPYLDPISTISMGSASTPRSEHVRVFVEVPAAE
jgi:hypothetical protein